MEINQISNNVTDIQIFKKIFLNLWITVSSGFDNCELNFLGLHKFSAVLYKPSQFVCPLILRRWFSFFLSVLFLFCFFVFILFPFPIFTNNFLPLIFHSHLQLYYFPFFFSSSFFFSSFMSTLTCWPHMVNCFGQIDT